MSKEGENLTSALKRSPYLVSILAIVAAFMFYIFRRDQLYVEMASKQDLVASQRIEHCHEVQDRATNIMDKLNTTLNSQHISYTELNKQLIDLRNIINDQSKEMNILILKINQLIFEINKLTKEIENNHIQ